MYFKSRYLLGATLAGAAIGLALFLELIGPNNKPEALVVNFSRGTTLSAGERERLVVFATSHAPQNQLTFNVVGHTGQRGDNTANKELSQQRAKIVADELKAVGIAQERILAVEGVGGADPLPKNNDLTESALQRSMARVVVTSLVKK